MHLAYSRDAPTRSAQSDEELVGLARGGDEAAVRTLVRRHNRQLFRVARGVVRDDAEAEDVVQATYVRAFTSLGTFRGEALLSTWLTRIALNEALGRLRRRRPTAELSDLDADNDQQGGHPIMFPTSPAQASPEIEVARNQVRHILEQAVDDLPETFRMVFVLRDIEGLDTEETATHLSIKAETVKTRLHRARRMMRSSIEGRFSVTFSELFPFDGARCASMADRVVSQLKARTPPAN